MNLLTLNRERIISIREADRIVGRHPPEQTPCSPPCLLAMCSDLRDLAEIVAYPGFFHLARRHWRMGMGEMWRSWNKAAFARAATSDAGDHRRTPGPGAGRCARPGDHPRWQAAGRLRILRDAPGSTWSTHPRRPRLRR